MTTSHTAAIVGGVVGGVGGLIALVVIVILVFVCLRRARRRKLDEAFDGNFDPDRIVRARGGTSEVDGYAYTRGKKATMSIGLDGGTFPGVESRQRYRAPEMQQALSTNASSRNLLDEEGMN